MRYRCDFPWAASACAPLLDVCCVTWAFVDSQHMRGRSLRCWKCLCSPILILLGASHWTSMCFAVASSARTLHSTIVETFALRSVSRCISRHTWEPFQVLQTNPNQIALFALVRSGSNPFHGTGLKSVQIWSGQTGSVLDLN